MIGVGIIGFGKMGRIRAEVLEDIPDIDIVGVYEPGIDQCKHFTYQSVGSMLGDGRVSAVFICTPNKFNEEYTILSLESGKHVFCEKPPAFTAAGVKRVMDAERKSGKKLMYGFNHRHHGSVIRAKEAIDSGQYGRVLWMRGRYGKRITEDQANGWRMDKKDPTAVSLRRWHVGPRFAGANDEHHQRWRACR